MQTVTSETCGMTRTVESKDAHRANCYRLLAECYRYPVIELTDGLVSLAREANALDPRLGPSAKKLRKQFQPLRGLTRLRIAYAKLFVGPGALIAAPYGSVYLEGNRQAMGNSTLDVVAYYLEAGLSPSLDNKEPPDHISTEMEFMYYLVFEYLRLRERRLAETQKKFFLAYIFPWVPQFAADIAESQIHPFYSALAVMTKDFLASEAKHFSGTDGC